MITASWKELYSIEVENLDKIDKSLPKKKLWQYTKTDTRTEKMKAMVQYLLN